MADISIATLVHLLNLEYNKPEYSAIILDEDILVPLFYREYTDEDKSMGRDKDNTIFIAKGDDIYCILQGYSFIPYHKSTVVTKDICVTKNSTGLKLTPVKSSSDFYALMNSKQLAENLKLRVTVSGMVTFLKEESQYTYEKLDVGEDLDNLYKHYFNRSFYNYYGLDFEQSIIKEPRSTEEGAIKDGESQRSREKIED